LADALIVSVTKAHSICFRCDASAEIGFGHLVRCLALADEIHHSSGGRIGFAMRDSGHGSDFVRQHGYQVFHLPTKSGDYSAWLDGTMRGINAALLVVDVRDDLSQAQLKSLGGEGCLIVLLDDLSDRRFAADLAFYPPVPQVRKADWMNFRGERFVGWKWTILRSQFAAPLQRETTGSSNLLITMGGSDPAGITLKAVRAAELVDVEFAATIILGPGFRHKNALRELLAKTRRQFTIRENVNDMRAQMVQSDLALCSYGMTAFELAASGVPAIYLCLTEDHAESASALADAGAGWSLGVASDVEDRQIADVLGELLADTKKRAQMSADAHRLIDGQGARRVAEVLAQRDSAL